MARVDLHRTPAPPRSVPYQEVRPSLPAELSGLHDLLSEVFADVLSEQMSRRTTTEEQLITARAGEVARGKTRTYRGAIGGLAAALIALGTWTISVVRSYGDSRAAAAVAEQDAALDAARAAASARDTRALVDSTVSRVDAIERKIDRLITLTEAQAQAHTQPEQQSKPRIR